MQAKTLSVTEVVRHFSDYISRVAYRHEVFVLCKGKRAIAELRPVPSGRYLGDLPRLLASLPRLSDEESETFSEDINRSRSSLRKEALRDPWES